MNVSKRNLEIVKRVERLGWDVETGNGRSDWKFRIVCPDGYRVQLHTTPSDVNWERAVMKDLNDHGLAEAEQEHLLTTERDRRDKIKRDAERNAKALVEAQERANNLEILARAAGSVAPQVARPDWILAPHAFPETRRVLITPDLAGVMLDSFNPENRPMRASRVDFWRKMMRTDRFTFTHQGGASNVNGNVQDGQHRLCAAALEGFTLDMLWTVGMPVENFGKVDTGAGRTAGDTFATLQRDKPIILGAALRLCYLYDRYGPEMRVIAAARGKLSNDDLIEYDKSLREKYRDLLDKSVNEAVRINSTPNAPHMSPHALSAGIFLISRRLPDGDERVREFLRGYVEGTNLLNGDIRLVLARAVFNMRIDRNRKVPVQDQLGYLLKAWNFWCTNQTRSNLTFRKDEMMPTVFLPPRPDLGISYNEDGTPVE